MPLPADFTYQVLAIVGEIPPGQVATYGQIAALTGYPRHARQVGHILSRSEYYGDFPCHRVVNATGRLAPHWPAQKTLLEKEGIIFTNSHRHSRSDSHPSSDPNSHSNPTPTTNSPPTFLATVNLHLYQWQP